jgi:hypothetical protein
MPETPSTPRPEPSSSQRPLTASQEQEWHRRKRLAEVFGDVLPATTSDERDPEPTPGDATDDAGDRWLRAQVPPHHG